MFFLLTNQRPIVFNFADDSTLYSSTEINESITKILELVLKLCLKFLNQSNDG